MLTILTLEILNGKSYSDKKKNQSGVEKADREIYIGLSEEQIRKEKKERLENFIILLPILIILTGIIVMYILEKIYLK